MFWFYLLTILGNVLSTCHFARLQCKCTENSIKYFRNDFDCALCRSLLIAMILFNFSNKITKKLANLHLTEFNSLFLFEYDLSPDAHVFEYLVPSWWHWIGWLLSIYKVGNCCVKCIIEGRTWGFIDRPHCLLLSCFFGLLTWLPHNVRLWAPRLWAKIDLYTFSFAKAFFKSW